MASTFFSPSGQEQIAEVLRENLHGGPIALELLLHRGVQLACRRNQALVGIGRRQTQLLGERAARLHADDLLDALHQRLGLHHQAHE